MRVVLSRPYSNSLAWWFDTLRNSGSGGDARVSRNSYYAHIYEDAAENLDVALTALVVFEEAILPGLDAPDPGRAGESQVSGNPDLGYQVEGGSTSRAKGIMDELGQDLLADAEIQAVLGPLDEWRQRHELSYGIGDILLASEFDAPVICSTGRQRLVSRLLDLDVVSGASDTSPILGRGKESLTPIFTQRVRP